MDPSARTIGTRNRGGAGGPTDRVSGWSVRWQLDAGEAADLESGEVGGGVEDQLATVVQGAAEVSGEMLEVAVDVATLIGDGHREDVW